MRKNRRKFQVGDIVIVQEASWTVYINIVGFTGEITDLSGDVGVGSYTVRVGTRRKVSLYAQEMKKVGHIEKKKRSGG